VKLSFNTEIEGIDYGMNVSVEGDFTRGEPDTREEPGCADSFEPKSVTWRGIELVSVLTQRDRDTIEATAILMNDHYEDYKYEPEYREVA